MKNNGLYNSAKFVVEMLNKENVSATLIQVFDSDSIDAAIKKYKPTIVVLEALWVEPKNLKYLQYLNPQVRFLIRIHSESAFLVQEVIAESWIKQYLQMGISVGFNSYRTAQIMSNLYPDGSVLFSPDYFRVTKEPAPRIPNIDVTTSIDIGCFGALRLLKNQLNQGIAAIQFGREVHRPINFHINTSFHGDTSGVAILANLRALFDGEDATLVEHPWHTEEEFTAILSSMDVVTQVSLSETFNLVAAEATNLRIPVVVSSEISWAGEESKAHPTSVKDITSKIAEAIENESLVHDNIHGLRKYGKISKQIWLEFVYGCTG
jgi:glycosyltransferase involved in cell wall biosynthesis